MVAESRDRVVCTELASANRRRLNPIAINIVPRIAAIKVDRDPVNGSVPFRTAVSGFRFGSFFDFGGVGGVNGAVVVDSAVVVVSVAVDVARVVEVVVVVTWTSAQSSFPGWPSLPAPPGDPFEHRGRLVVGGVVVVVVELLGRHSEGAFGRSSEQPG